MGLRHIALAGLRRSGALGAVAATYGRNRLTVLAYHRVTDPEEESFAGFPGNVSATPHAFARQMEWMAERFAPVSIEQVAAAVGGEPLPVRPFLITFDDGYRDNLDNAHPVLLRLGIPATIFLATDHIGTAEPFWWDLVAWHFSRSYRRAGDLPLLGDRLWSDPHRMAVDWIKAAKALSDDAKVEAVTALTAALDAGDVGNAFRTALLDWDQVRTMAGEGVAFGAHTRTHPILTRIPEDRVGAEVEGSVDRVRVETGMVPLGFAYPNGLKGDYDDVAQVAVRSAGVPLGFTLLPGPVRAQELRRHPLAIRRVHIHHRDGMDRFVAKVSGLSRLTRR